MRRSRFVSLFVMSAVLMGLSAALVTPASARLASSEGIGGPGGVPFRLDCGEYGLLIGVSGRSGIVIDQIGGVCVKIDPISGVWVGGSYETAHYGGSGGGPFNKRCPVGQALWGLEGAVNYFDGTPVVGSIDIKCIDIALQAEKNGTWIGGTRLINYYGDPDPLKVQAEQDYCDYPSVGTNVHREPRVWNRIGLALEGRAGLFVDRVHIVCDWMPTNQTAYHIDFKPASNILVPEGTPVQISWRASGVKPELTPNLRYEWDLKDWTHTGTVFGIAQPTTVQNACAYAAQPCTSSWFGSSSFSSATFNSLPVGAYELELSVSPTTLLGINSGFVPTKGTVKFEIRPNLLVSLTMSPESVQAGAPTTGTVTMEGPAGQKGRILYLFSSNPNLVPVPPSLTVPGGSATGMFTLHPNSAPGSAGQVTISVSTNPPLSAKFSTSVQGVLSRGVEEAGQAPPGDQPVEGQPPTPAPEGSVPQSTSSATSENTVQNQEVSERGITPFQMIQKSTGVQSAIVMPPPAATPPSATLPAGQLGAAAQVRPGPQTGAMGPDRLKLNLPSATKSAVISVPLPFGIQFPSK
jgi:hypothetical protein